MPIPQIVLRPAADARTSPAKRIDGNTSRYEQQVLATIIGQARPQRILELGTFNGLSTHTMALNAPAARILTVDIPQESLNELQLPVTRRRRSYDDVRYIRKNSIGTTFANTPEARRITQLLCDTALLEERIKGKRFDLIFVDASHSYEYTRNDTALALRHLAKGGTIIWHDYGKRCWPGVKRALDELYVKDERLRRIEKTSFVMLR
jgi:predicted O-methyltransferase YrrM